MKRISVRRWALAAALATALGSTTLAGTAGALPVAPAGFNSVIDQAREVGSDTTFFQMQAFSDLYNSAPGCKVPSTAADGADWSECNDNLTGVITTENFDHDEIVQAAPFGVGSGNGLRQLCNMTGGTTTQPAHFARSSRAVRSTECVGIQVTQRGFARDGFAFLTFTNRQAYVINGSNQVTQGPPSVGCKPNESPTAAQLASLGTPTLTPAPGTTSPCTGALASSGNRKFSDKLIKAVWAHVGGNVSDWCQLNDAVVTTGDGNDPWDANPVFATCTGSQPIEKWAVNTGSGTYGFFKDDVLGGPDPNAFATQAVSSPIQENDANPIRSAGSDIMGRSMHWGSYGRFKATPYPSAGAFINPAANAGSGPAAPSYITPTVANIGKNTSCTATTCYAFARVVYNVVKTADNSGPGLAAKAFLEWMCKTSAHAINDDTGNNFDLDISKIYSRFFIARMGGVASTFGPCVDSTFTN